MKWTTRQSPYDVEALFPFLKGMGRETTRLHPRPESSLSPTISKIGGSFLWPVDETLPVCPEKSCPAVPLMQLRRDDFRSIGFPNSTDLLQILWYPQAYDDWKYNPKLEVYWRDSSRLSSDSVLEPLYQNHDDSFVVRECRVYPETVIEYPYIGLLSEEQQETIWQWEDAQDDPMAAYQYCLSTCPGIKVGGYPDYGGQDAPIIDTSEGQQLEYLLTLSSSEWDDGSDLRWKPLEEWTEELNRPWFEISPFESFLKVPINVFLDKSTDPYTYRIE